MAKPVISVDIGNKSFAGTPILDNIQFEIFKGDAIALLGPSGIGKSTLLRMIAGLDSQFTGKIECHGKIGFVFQEPTLLSWRNVEDNLSIPGGSPKLIEHYLNKTGLSHKAAHYPDQLSLGQRRRLALARAFAINPDILLLDEPFVSLDETLSKEMLELTRELIDETEITTIFVTHSSDEAHFLAKTHFYLEGMPAKLSQRTL